jgi:hypothetical protein
MRRIAWLLAPLLLTGGLGGCASFGELMPPHCPVELVASDALPTDLWLRAKMRFEIDEQSVALEAVARARPDGLAVVGIAPYGATVFGLRQRGDDIVVETAATRDQRYLAHFTLDALHRIYWIEAPEGAGDSTWARAGEQISETRENGARRRTFTRGKAADTPTGGRPDGVTIEYPGKAGDGIHISNPWCGYEAVVVTVDAAPRPPASAGSDEQAR